MQELEISFNNTGKPLKETEQDQWRDDRAFLDHLKCCRIFKSFLKSFVWSVILYGRESWTMNEAMKKSIEATEMWFYRRMMISWTQKKINEEILSMVQEKKRLLKTIIQRQLRFVGHIMRKPIGTAMPGRLRGRGSERQAP